MNQKSFILYTSWYEPLKNLSKEDKGEILDAIFQYHLKDELPELSPVAAMAFSFMKSGFDENKLKYDAIVDRNRTNGKAGGRPLKNPKNPLGNLETQKTQTNPKNLEYDSVSDNDSVSVSDSKNKKEKLKKIQDEFYLTLTPFVKTYSKEMVRKFYNYWSEPNKTKTKVRYQMEKTWDIERRLITWNDREKNFNEKPKLELPKEWIRNEIK